MVPVIFFRIMFLFIVLKTACIHFYGKQLKHVLTKGIVYALRLQWLKTLNGVYKMAEIATQSKIAKRAKLRSCL